MVTTQNPMSTSRIWFYETCTQFAFYQTCDVGSSCIFSQGYNSLNDSLTMCNQAYGIAPEAVAYAVNATNTYYGGNKPAGTRIMFPNGDIDP